LNFVIIFLIGSIFEQIIQKESRPSCAKSKYYRKNTLVSVTSEKGNILLKELQKQGFDVYLSCGGNGTCG